MKMHDGNNVEGLVVDMFATPVAYMVDQAGVISHDVAVGVESIQTLMAEMATGPLEARRV
jgi:hypothetical protein